MSKRIVGCIPSEPRRWYVVFAKDRGRDDRPDILGAFEVIGWAFAGDGRDPMPVLEPVPGGWTVAPECAPKHQPWVLDWVEPSFVGVFEGPPERAIEAAEELRNDEAAP
jgi:hypothetical protein